MNKNSKIYVVMEPERREASGEFAKIYDLAPALEYGDIVSPAIFTRQIYDVSPEWLFDQAKKSLDKLTANDYLLLIGDPVAMVIAGIAAYDSAGTGFSFLRWNPREKKYSAIKFTNQNKEEHDERIRERSHKIRRYFGRQTKNP